MAREGSRRDEDEDSLATADWIGRIAESEGVDEDEVVERLVSAYWTLQEMSGMIEDTETGEPTMAPSASESAVEALRADLEDYRERIGTVEERLADLETDDSVAELRSGVEAVEGRIEAVESRLSADHRSLESRFDDELGHLDTILTYLVETTDGLQDELAAMRARRGRGPEPAAADDPGSTQTGRGRLRGLWDWVSR